jgi:hypothetical protein
VDPYAQYWSPYLAMGNNPVSRVDPDGGADGSSGGDPTSLWQKIVNFFVGVRCPPLEGISQKTPKNGKAPGVSKPKANSDNFNGGAGQLNASRMAKNTSPRPLFNVDKAVDHLNSNAITKPGYFGGSCSPFVPNAINAGFGSEQVPTNKAGGSYGPELLAKGFIVVSVSSIDVFQPEKGDIAVIEGYPGGTPCKSGPCGHIQMYNGKQWVSDFFQTRPFWPGSGYQNHKPAFQIYRWDSVNP